MIINQYPSICIYSFKKSLSNDLLVETPYIPLNSLNFQWECSIFYVQGLLITTIVISCQGIRPAYVFQDWVEQSSILKHSEC